MNRVILIGFCLFATVLTAQEIDQDELKCLVCRSTIEEMEDVLAKINPNQQIEIGNYRLDADGNMIRKKVPLFRSEVHISDELDKICKKLDDYVRARYKSNGQLTIFNLLSPSGQMNPDMSKVDIIQDGDLNRSLKFICEQIVEEHEESIIDVLKSAQLNNINEICTKATSICEDEIPGDDSDDNNNDDDDDNDYRSDKVEL